SRVGISQTGSWRASRNHRGLLCTVEMMKIVITTLLGSALLQTPPPPPRPGVKAPGVRIPIERLTPEAVFPVPGMPDWIAVDEDVWISNAPKDTVARLDPRTNTVAA